MKMTPEERMNLLEDTHLRFSELFGEGFFWYEHKALKDYIFAKTDNELMELTLRLNPKVVLHPVQVETTQVDTRLIGYLFLLFLMSGWVLCGYYLLTK